MHRYPLSGVRAALVGLLSFLSALTGALPADAAPRTKNVAALEDLARRFQERHDAERAALEAAPTDHPVLQAYAKDPRFLVVGMKESGHPIIHKFDGLVAAQTITTDEVWNGGPAGFALDGDRWGHNYLSFWDSGSVRATHQEFGGRVFQVDSPANQSNHATRVAGVLVASGVNGIAIGMSPNAELLAFDSIDDDAEMANQALINLHVSNHSYATTAGWDSVNGLWFWNGWTSVSTQEDFEFGRYSQDARDWDEIAFNAPNYLIVGGAGNDRNDTGPAAGTVHFHYVTGGYLAASADTHPADGGATGYDTMPSLKTGKNILTVGGVQDIFGGYSGVGSVQATAFAAWGPTDDGRIKPDVVANAQTIVTADSSADNAYVTNANGCSYAGPGVAGSVNLMLQHWNDTHGGQEPLSSTLKAILVHTADEAGPASGPDYMFGWGLVNTRTAVELIDADLGALGARRIIEETLTDGGTDEYTFWWDGESPFDVTLAWIDPPGIAQGEVLDDSTPRLVNDLDLTVERLASGAVTMPWVMLPLQPAVAPGRGDNDLDNVEQVTVDGPSAGYYRAIVQHEGSLDGGSQDYSLILPAREHVCVTEHEDAPGTLLDVPGTMQQWVDVDGDARPDELILEPGSEVVQNHNEGGGIFSRVPQPELDDFGPIADGFWEDFDLDGSPDFCAVSGDGTKLGVFRNDGQGQLQEPMEDTANAGAVTDVEGADLDGDGDVDAYVCIADGPNRVYRNDGGGQMSLVPAPALAWGGATQQACFANVDGDRRPELFLVNSDGPNVLLDHDGSSWTERFLPPSGDASYGAFWADLDGNLELDLYVANDPDEGDRCLLSLGTDFVAANLPWLGDGNDNRPGALPGDWDNDGLEDLLLPHHDVILENLGQGVFDPNLAQLDSAGYDVLHAVDVLQDGTLDVGGSGASGSGLTFNDPCDPDSRWIQVGLASDLATVRHASVLVEAGDTQQVKQLGTGNGAGSNTPAELHFGLGDAVTVDRIRVEWPDGTTIEIEDIGPNQQILVQQGQIQTGAPEVAAVAGGPSGSRLLPNSPNPFRGRTDVRFQMDRGGRVELAVYSVAGRLVRKLAEGRYEPGTHVLAWDGRDAGGRPLASGVYFVRLQGEGVSETRRVVMLK